MTETPRPNRWQRFAEWDERPLRLDKFAREDPANGFSAFRSPHDPKPGIAVSAGKIAAMDGVLAHDFDMIDAFIAAHHLDSRVVEEAMAIPSETLARMLVDMNVPRTELVRLAHGLTPAKLADAVSKLNALEIAFAYSKMRARKTPGNQAHVTNAKDDPLQLAADAAIAVAYGFDEVETTMRVARNAWVKCRGLCSRGMGVQGTQNGGIDGAPLTATVPGGVRELMAENLIAVWLDLECASGNDARSSESEIRVGAKILPYLIAGSDLICSGFGSILAYDNSFNPSLFNGEEMEDYLVLQRDFEADGGLTPVAEHRALDLRLRAVEAIAAVFEELGLAQPTADMKASVVSASGSADTRSYSPGEVAPISEAIRDREITVIDVIKALATRGFVAEAENLLNVVKLRVSGDYLQTSAIVRGGRVVSAINDPNDYQGPGSGYRMTEARRQDINDIRDLLDQDVVLRAEAEHKAGQAARISYDVSGAALQGGTPDEVVIGISPAFGLNLFQTTAGHKLSDLLRVMIDGIQSRGLRARIVRFRHTADTSFLGLSAARLSGSGIGIGIQAKGTAVIHSSTRLPHNNLELFSNAPITLLEHYAGFGRNAAAYALGESPEPVVVPTRGEAMGSRYHARVALIYAIETGLIEEGAAPEEIAVTFLQGGRR